MKVDIVEDMGKGVLAEQLAKKPIKEEEQKEKQEEKKEGQNGKL